MKDTKKTYMAPQLTVVSFRVEAGFLNSQVMDLQLINFNDMQEEEQMETYSTHSGWNTNDNHFWN